MSSSPGPFRLRRQKAQHATDNREDRCGSADAAWNDQGRDANDQIDQGSHSRLGPSHEEARLPAENQIAPVQDDESRKEPEDIERMSLRGCGQHKSRRDDSEDQSEERENSFLADHPRLEAMGGYLSLAKQRCEIVPRPGRVGNHLCAPSMTRMMPSRFLLKKLFESPVCMAAPAALAQSGRAPDC